MNIWSDKKILLGVTGSIAAYKSILLLRQLQELGAEVRVVMTPAAVKMIGTGTFAALTRSPVLVQDPDSEDYFTHIDWARWADIFLIAPATANTINTLAAGLTPNSLSLLWLAFTGIKAIIPAMNPTMYSNPVTTESIERLERYGVYLMPPDEGLMACGETGQGRFPSEVRMIDFLEGLLLPPVSRGKVTLCAGRTLEAIDPVRYISNRSSGQTALSLAKALRAEGFSVEVISGPCEVSWEDYFSWLSVREVQSAEQMFEAAQESFAQSDVLIMNAAVADYRPSEIATEKIKDSRSQFEIQLRANPDILKTLSQQKRRSQKTVGFALETDCDLQKVIDKRAAKECDLLVFNRPVQKDGQFDSAVMESAILTSQGFSHPLQIRARSELVRAIVDSLLQEMKG